jgi:hypothetical protein
MSTTLELLVAIIAQIVQTVLPNLASQQTTTLVETIITTLEKILPDVITAGQELTTTVQNIIAALKGTDGITPDQWNALDAFEKQIDSEFDQAATDEGL